MPSPLSPVSEDMLGNTAASNNSAFTTSLLTAVVLGNVAQVQKLAPTRSLRDVCGALICAAAKNHPACVEALLKGGYSFGAETIERSLNSSASGGHIECLKMLLPHIAATDANLSRALSSAAQNGQAECVRLLLNVSADVGANTYALICAAEHRKPECVQLLLSVSEPKMQNSRALRAAAKSGCVRSLRLLLPHSDAWRNNSEALLLAALHNNAECVEVLLPVSDCVAALKILKRTHPKSTHATAMLERILWAQEENKVLRKVVDMDTNMPHMNANAVVRPRKM